MSPSTEARSPGEFAQEIKFLISPGRAEQLADWAAGRLEADPHSGDGARYCISTLYVDTEAFDVFHRRGSFGRSKYRIRRYGRTESAFLERKLKTNGRVGKTRAEVDLAELAHLEGGLVPGWSGHWFQRRLAARRLRPVCQVSYLRTARYASTPQGPIRLTIDEDIRTLPVSAFGFETREPGLPVLTDVRIVEMKFRREMPVLFKEAVERFLLIPAPSSKYRQAVSALGILEPAWATS